MMLPNKLITPLWQKKQSPSTTISPASKPAKSAFSKGYFCLVLNQHKLLGALAPVFFYAHAQHLGYAYLQALSLVYFAIILSGLCNVVITRIRKDWFQKIRITVHVGLAAGLMFLLGYHIFISYAY